MSSQRIRGVLSPVVTPFKADLSPDTARWIRHCKWLMSQGVGLAVFGTNSEANSLSFAERHAMLEQLVAAGIDTSRIMPGTGCCSLPESVELSAHATKLGCAGVLMLPPFYYKGVPDEGLYRAYSEVIQRVGDARLRIYLYHIPPVSNVPISLALIERLLKAYPTAIAGVKDSSGEWANTQAMCDQFSRQGFDVFAGSESFLLRTLRANGVGCITAGANVNPAMIVKLYETWREPGADELQKKIDDIRAVLQSAPMIAAMKATIAHHQGDADWARMRPPLVETSPEQTRKVLEGLDRLGFTMPGIRQAVPA